MSSNGALLKRLEKLESTGLGLSASERDIDARRKRERRSESARIFVPACVNPQRRERCLADPELCLKTYFADKYTRPFTRLHRGLIDSMVEIATSGGEKAIAAPRGRGKSEIVKGVICYLILAGLVRFPVPVSQTTGHSQELYEDFRRKINLNELLYEDFPEICHPVRCLEGAPQRSSRQHIDGQLTQVEWKVDRLRLPNVPEKYRGPIDYGGVRMEFRGLDAAIRGINRDGDRPDFIPIDEPETRESAKSQSQIDDRVNALEKDVAGLAGEDHELAQVMLTTLQNNYCLSAQFTDPEQKPSWMGERYGWVETWPEEYPREAEATGMWHTYMAMRGEDQRNGDRYGKRATQYYLDNKEQLERGGELLSDNYKHKLLPDGKQTVYSAWQEVFNFIADKSYEAFCTEYQNDPPEQEKIDTLELEYSKITGSLSCLEQGEIPDGTLCTTLGIDIGKYECFYTKIAWHADATGTVVDYGIVRTQGLNRTSSDEATETAIMAALEQFAEAQDEENMPPLLALVDSGNWSTALYESCRRIGTPYFPAKGLGGEGRAFRMPKPGDTDKQPYLEAYASKQYDSHRREFWLYDINTLFWKNWLQERWILQTWERAPDGVHPGIRTPSSLALFDPPGGDNRFHVRFAKSQVSERLINKPMPNKGYKPEWVVEDRRNNHWLDAAALACAAAGCVGVRLVQPRSQAPVVPTKPKAEQQKRQRFGASGRPFLVTQR